MDNSGVTYRYLKKVYTTDLIFATIVISEEKDETGPIKREAEFYIDIKKTPMTGTDPMILARHIDEASQLYRELMNVDLVNLKEL